MVYLIKTRLRFEIDIALRQALRSVGRLKLTEAEAMDDAVRKNAEWLLERLYTPHTKYGCTYSGRRAKLPSGEWLSLRGESISWGNLNVTDCMRDGDLWDVTLEEAMAGHCPHLCRYVEEWLTAWGWPCHVSTEW